MTRPSPLGLGGGMFDRDDAGRTEYVHTQRPLRKLLDFRRRTIDDVVNHRVVKNEILGYWKFQKQITRRTEVAELERQWNAVRL